MITVPARDEDSLVFAYILHAGQLVGVVERAHVSCPNIPAFVKDSSINNAARSIRGNWHHLRKLLRTTRSLMRKADLVTWVEVKLLCHVGEGVRRKAAGVQWRLAACVACKLL